MAHQEFHLSFEGYWRDVDINGLPNVSGIYCVYCCTYNNEKKNLSIRELIYIGEAKDLNDRISKHEKWEDWKKRLKGESAFVLVMQLLIVPTEKGAKQQ